MHSGDRVGRRAQRGATRARRVSEPAFRLRGDEGTYSGNEALYYVHRVSTVARVPLRIVGGCGRVEVIDNSLHVYSMTRLMRTRHVTAILNRLYHRDNVAAPTPPKAVLIEGRICIRTVGNARMVPDVSPREVLYHF